MVSASNSLNGIFTTLKFTYVIYSSSIKPKYIISLNHCATRLRLELKDNSIIDEQKIKNAGAIGITQNGHHYTQVIIGTHVQQVANEMDHQMN